MWGRAGRRSEGIAMYVAGQDGLDQFFCRHPDEFLERPVEAAILDHRNERIQAAHLLAAAYELPLSGSDDDVFGEGWHDRADALVAAGELRRGRDGNYLPRTPRFPAGDISLRSASADSVAIVDSGSGELLGAVEAERAFTTVHPGAVYLHLGRSYEVRELDVEARRAVVDPFEGDWYTQPRRETEVYVERMLTKSHAPLGAATTNGSGGTIGADPSVSGFELFFGEVSVTEQVTAFQRKRLSDHEVIDMVALELPETNFPTQALWYVLGDELVGPDVMPPEVLLGALHATEHGQIAVLPLLAMCDRWDIFIYDGHPGGVGIARRGFDVFGRLVGDATKLIGECQCADGCPSCVQSPKCGNLNEPLHKRGALELMTAMLARTGAKA
jgi:DEAD/DEAH box helicase domain-containing protein